MSRDNLTVSALALTILGPMAPGDGGVAVQYDGASRTWYDCRTFGALDTLTVLPGVEARIVVAESREALLRALARHLGWDGEGLPELRAEHWGEPWRWVLRSFTKTNAPAGDPYAPLFSMLPAHISPDLGHDRALAEAVAFYARVEQLRREGLGEPFRGPTWSEASLARAEQARGLPPIEVRG